MTSVPADEGLRRSVRRLGLALSVALLGLVFSHLVTARDHGISAPGVASSPAYGTTTTTLLAVGLFASAYGVSRRELARNARVVIAAITLGVAVKALLTGTIMALAYDSVAFMLLGVAVAQIDPLSVAATLRHSVMSARAKSILSAWASFDDPVTVLLVVYLASATLPGANKPNKHGPETIVNALADPYLRQALLNALLVAAAAVAWSLTKVLDRKWDGDRRSNILRCAVLLLLIVVSIKFDLLIGITICGLFFRPAIDGLISGAVNAAFYAATFLLGMLLIMGTNVLAGLLLGVVVFLVQVLTGFFISRKLPFTDRVHLALGQQNGITAIVLALALQPYIPRAVGIIAVAILAVNTLHIVSNGLFDRRLKENPGLRDLAECPVESSAARHRLTPWPEKEGAGAGKPASG